MYYLSSAKSSRGFTLIEMAIVMVILGSLMAGLLVPLATQREHNKQKATTQLLQEIRQALLGSALANGFPCPASAASNGREAPRTPTGDCSLANGFVPYATIGVQGSVQNGLLVDEWQTPIRYRVTAVNNWQYTKANIPIFGATAANFSVCSTSPCTLANTLAANVVVVIFSTGKDGVNVPPTTSTDQLVNLNGGNSFVSRMPQELAGFEFDDQLVWISQAALIYELSKMR